MSLSEIVRVCGGDLYSSGRRASIPAPGHSRADRSASLVIGKTGRVVAYSFGGSTVRDILDGLRSQGLIDRAGYPIGSSPLADAGAAISDGQKRATAVKLWSHGVPLAGTLSERHLVQRALDPALVSQARLLHHPACPLSVYGNGSRSGPALMALILAADGSPCAVELTYLDAAGRRNRSLRLSRKTIGIVPPGAFVPLSDLASHMVVGEGVVTTLSAMTILGLPGQALLGARNLPRYILPSGVSEITIAADRGGPGEGAAHRLKDRLTSQGVRVHIRLPDEPFEDFNLMLEARAQGRGEGGGG